MKAIVVHKTSKLAVLEEGAPERVEHLRASNPEAYGAMAESAARQAEAGKRVEDALVEAGFSITAMGRGQFDAVPADTDLVVAVGGDGTVLDVSHKVFEQPLVGINSDPGRSVGYFCAGDARDARGVFDRFIAGESGSSVLHRIALTVDGKPYPFPCMNDLLVTNRNPAMMSRYIMTAGERSETHASSGVWISTPAGSTAGIRSAGGTVMPLDGSLIQYLVREPYMTGDARYPLHRGVRHLSEGLRVRSLMDGGAVYVDGPYIEIPFQIGSELTLSEGPPLRLVELDPVRRER